MTRDPSSQIRTDMMVVEMTATGQSTYFPKTVETVSKAGLPIL